MDPRPDRLHLQWHLTEACPLHCRHCYQESTTPRPQFTRDQAWNVLDQWEAWLKDWGVPGFLTFTGGEPLVWPPLREFLAEVHRRGLGFNLLTNGLLLDEAWCRDLKRWGCASVQVSLDGGPQGHDALRGPGNYQKVLRALDLLRAAGLKTLVSFTASRENRGDMDQVWRLCREKKVWRFWSDRLIPLGEGSGLAGMSPEEAQEYFRDLARLQSRGNPRQVPLHRALQFQGRRRLQGPIYSCEAARRLLCLQADGTLVPCRRMPLVQGSVFETPLKELYLNSPLFQALRSPQAIPQECRSCGLARRCRGGLKCLSQSLLHSPFQKDPHCLRVYPMEANIELLKLPPAYKKDLGRFLQQIKTFYAQDLEALILFGSAVKGTFRPGVSDLNLLVVYSNLNVADLEKVSALALKWRRKRNFAPRFLSLGNLKAFSTHFPVDLLDISGAYQVLSGRDLLADLQPDKKALAWQMAFEIKGLRLRVKQQFWRLGHQPKTLRRLILDRWASVKLLARGLLFLKGRDPGAAEGPLLPALAQELSFPQAALEALQNLRDPRNPAPLPVLRDHFKALMDLIRALDTAAEDHRL